MEQLMESNDRLLDELIETKIYCRNNITKCTKILNDLITTSDEYVEEMNISKQLIKGEIIQCLKILNRIVSKVSFKN